MSHTTLLFAVVLLNAVGACGQRAQETADLDLGGGISMTPDGEIKGATSLWPSGVPAEEGVALSSREQGQDLRGVDGLGQMPIEPR